MSYRKSLFMIVVFVIIISFNPIFAQSGWINQESGTSHNLNEVVFMDANTGTVVGDSGTILRTIDGGETWLSQSSGTTMNLYGVSFIDSNTGTVVGDSGTILRTINGGETWTSQSSGTIIPLNGVKFTDTNTGVVVGGYRDYYHNELQGIILKTMNGGETWTSQFSGTTKNLYSVFFTDANIGTVVGDTIFHTTNGCGNWAGQTWTNLCEFCEYNTLRRVHFTDANTGTAVGGRYSWGTEANSHFSDGAVINTKDGGVTWTVQLSGIDEYLYGVVFTDANNGWIVGGSYHQGLAGMMVFYRKSRNIILHTEDGGTLWTIQKSDSISGGPDISFTSLYFTDNLIGTVVGKGGVILRTTNGGITWFKDNKEPDITQNYRLIQNYPNPFNPSTTIEFDIPTSGFVSLKVYNIMGQEVATLINKELSAGKHKVEWKPENLSSGIYFYKLDTKGYQETKKLILMK